MFFGALGTKTFAQNDFDGPALSLFTVSPSSVDISSGPATVTVSIRATDSSGVLAPSAKPYVYDTNIAGSVVYANANWSLVSGDQYDGVYEASLMIDPSVFPSGDYSIHEEHTTFTDSNNFSAANINNVTLSVVNFSGTSPPSTGDGSLSDPYHIDSFADLWWISQDSNRWAYHYLQTNDIDAYSSAYLNNGKGFSPIGNINTAFTGSYDGQHYAISSLYIKREQAEEVALFGLVNNGVIKNITLYDPIIVGDLRVGALVGELKNSYSQFSDNHVFEGFVLGNTTIGGLVGRVGNGAYIHASSYTGTVTGYSTSQNFSGSGNPQNIGGLVGKIKPTSFLTASYFNGFVFGVNYVGGIVGVNSGSKISNSYAIGTVTAENNYAGGISGNSAYNDNDSGRVHNFTSTVVSSMNNSSGIGPIVGAQDLSSGFTYEGADNFWNADLTQLTSAGGSIDFSKTTQELKTQSTFTDEGWDFDDKWIISGNVNDGFPFIRGNNDVGLVDLEFDEQSLTASLSFSYPLYSDDDLNTALEAADVTVSIDDPENSATLTSDQPLNFQVSSDLKSFSFTVSITGDLDGNEELRIAPSDTSFNDDQELYLSYPLDNIDIVPPTLLSFTTNSSSNSCLLGESLIFTANFNESLSASPSIKINNDYFVMDLSPYGVEELNQNNSLSNAGAGGTDQWQSFTVSETGLLSKVGWKMANPVLDGQPQPISLKVYRGEGTSGTLVSSSEGLETPAYTDENGNAITGQYVYFDLTSANVSVTANETLTLRLSLINNEQNVSFLDLNTNNSYAGGRASNNSNSDYVFKTFVRPSSAGSENWTYHWTADAAASATVSATDLFGNAYSGTDSITLAIESSPTTFTLESSDSDHVVSQGNSLTITATFSETLNGTPTLSLVASDTYNGAYLNLVDSAEMTALSTSTWAYVWTVNTTSTFDYVTTELNLNSDNSQGITPSSLATSSSSSLTFVIDNNPPGIADLSYDSSTNAIAITFNEPVFASHSAQTASGSITADNFDLSLSDGTALLNNNPIESITVSGTTYLIALQLDGFISGDEKVYINTGNAIYDKAGNEFLIENNSTYISLIDNTQPYVIARTLSQDNTEVILNFNERLVASSMANFDSSTASSTDFNVPTKTTATSSWQPWSHAINLDIPEGYVVSKVRFNFDAKDQGWGGTNANATIKLNGTEIGKAQLTHNYQNFTLEKISAFPDFNYNGTNELFFYFMGWPGWSSTTQNGVLTIYYTALDLDANDFQLNLSGGSANLASNTPSSLTASNTSFILSLPIQGIADGNEVLSVAPVTNAIYDAAGNTASSTNINFTLYDKTPSIISSTTLSNTNTGVIVRFSETLNTFSNWADNQPNNEGTEEYGLLQSNGKIYDYLDIDAFAAVIEFDQTTSFVEGLGFIGNHNGHSYFKLTAQNTWPNAKAIAEDLGGYLVVINTDAEKNYLIQQNLGDVWIGLYQDTNDQNYSEPSGGWKWLNGVYANMGGDPLDGISLSINGGTADLSSASPVSISTTGSLSYLIELPLTGPVSGDEIVTIEIASNTLYDSDGNLLSSTQTNNSVRLNDTSTPLIDITHDQDDLLLSGGQQITLNATANELLSAPPVLSFSNQVTATMATTSSATLWTYDWTVPIDISGSISITILGFDEVGNANTNSASLTFLIDNSTAEALLETNQSDLFLNGNDSVTVTATFNEPIAGGVQLNIANDAISVQPDMTATSSSVWHLTWQIPPNWTEGAFDISILTATDLAGNPYSGTVSVSFVLDTTAPSLSLDWDKNTAYFKSNDELRFTANFNELISQAPVFSLSQITSPTAMTATTSQTVWVYDFETPVGLNLTTSVTIEGEDRAGNQFLYTYPNDFFIDSNPPSIETLNLSDDNSRLTLIFNEALYKNEQSLSSVDPGDIDITLSGGTAILETSGSQTIAVLDDKNIQIDLNISGPASGEEILSITIDSAAFFDQAGNEMQSQQATNSIELFDTTAPYVETIRLVDNTSVELVFNESPYLSDNSSTPLSVTDFVLSTLISSATLVSSTPLELIQNGKELTIRFELQGDIPEQEQLIIQLLNPITDENQNITSTITNNQVYLIVDSDKDGVSDDLDLCPSSPEGENVDAQGCAESEKDNDQDGVPNGLDLCPESENGEDVDDNGCSKFQRDPDQDGIELPIDQCPETPLGQIVDENGCGVSDQDEDLDGVPNEIDQCPDTPLNEKVDENGCTQLQNDTDLDGILNADDLCPNTRFGIEVNENGCSLEQEQYKQENADDDQDGVINLIDRCPDTPLGQSVDQTGCDQAELVELSETDQDFDGVNNEFDLCPDTAKGVVVNEFGCPLNEIDSDFDKINDAIDRCPFTPIGEEVDAFGCSLGQKENDTDLDGVENLIDRCPDTPFSEPVNEYGCSQAQVEKDSDLDGVPNELDVCPNTNIESEAVDENGCSEEQRDDDLDGVPNAIDRCQDTLENQRVDAFGCSEDQLDTDDDGDGIKNRKDICPNTEPGVEVDENGCAYQAAKIYKQVFERLENKRDDDVSNVNILLGKILIEDTNKSEDTFNNSVSLAIVENDYNAQNLPLFRLDGRKLYLIAGIDYEEKREHRVTLEAINDKG
ncbi:MAG: thrombospondin type 3 repeat-containing protein, partial [Flavobacteriaceae bacterium]